MTLRPARPALMLVAAAYSSAFGSVVAATAQNSRSTAAEFVGAWDIVGTTTRVKINADNSLDHSRLGSAVITLTDDQLYKVTYRHLHLNCYYQIKKYSETELSFVVAIQPSDQDCDLGMLRRAPDPKARPKSESDVTGNKPNVASLPPTSVFRDCPSCPDMVVVPSGSFEMGSRATEPDRYEVEGPTRLVTFSRPFAASRYPVTVEQFETYVKANGLTVASGCRVQGVETWDMRTDASPSAPGFSQAANHPVVCVNWQQASDYAAWLSETTGERYRLVTEAEAEYITRAGTVTAFWWGPTASPQRANYDATALNDALQVSANVVTARNSAKSAARADGAATVAHRATGTQPVQFYSPNPWGFFQVHGNAASWTLDCWNKTLAGAPLDGTASLTGDCKRRVIKGGAWTSFARDMRAAYRESAPAIEHYQHVGFRLAREIAP